MESWTLVTGASEGLGVEFAKLAAKEKRNLILVARSEDKLNALAEELRSDTVQVEVMPTDLSDLIQTEALWARVSEGRVIDRLVNNAGLGKNGAFSTPESWAQELTSMNVNMIALTYLMKQAIPHMQGHGGGRILNVASVAGFTPGPNMAVYHATKAFVLSLSEAVAEELSGSDVTITALCPGATATNFFDVADMDGVRLLKLAKPMSAKDVAEQGWIATRAGKRVVVTGALNKVFAFLPRITPRRVTTVVASKIMGKGH